VPFNASGQFGVSQYPDSIYVAFFISLSIVELFSNCVLAVGSLFMIEKLKPQQQLSREWHIQWCN